MKKNKLTILAAITVLGLSVLSGCGAGDKDPGEPPAEVVNGENTGAGNSNSESADTENNSVQSESSGMAETEEGDQYEGDIESPHIENRLFYNPDQVNYNSIFYRDELGQIASDDPKGKAMIRRLKLYRPIHSYAWILEKLTHIIERLDERVSVAIGDEKVRLEEKRNQLSNEYFKIYRQFVASYLSGR